MQDLKSFYKGAIAVYQEQLLRVKRQLFVSSMLRLIIFGLALLGIFLFWEYAKVLVAIIMVAAGLFLYLVSRHSNLQYERDRLQELLRINEQELEVLARNFSGLPQGNQYKDPQHYYSQDIDLFGKGSFFQYLNRTGLPEGSDFLASLLTENTTDNIGDKQEAIQELAKKPEWRQNFTAIAALTKTEVPIKDIIAWVGRYRTFLPSFMRWLPLVYTIASAIWVLLYFFGNIPEVALLYWASFGLVLTAIYGKKVTDLSHSASKAQSTFRQYYQLIAFIEQAEVGADMLRKKKDDLQHSGNKTSVLLKEFSTLLDALDRNGNLIYLVLGNGFFLSGLWTAYKMERWITKNGKEIEKWFTVVKFYDAYNSLGNFAYNHPSYAIPKIVPNVGVKATGASHPLLDPKKAVTNDYRVASHDFLIITGANMAGKSTFLRTVSLQIVMANMGLPVCADHFEYDPIKLITSMRTSDSLSDQESYFFSELKRLKFVIDELKKERYFVVLDEILKGTNSTDKAKGSRKFLERLVTFRATGLIATHDLSLCAVAEEYPEVKNYYFDAEIKDNELYFDYMLKKGICHNMNASFLLKKMDIIE